MSVQSSRRNHDGTTCRHASTRGGGSLETRSCRGTRFMLRVPRPKDFRPSHVYNPARGRHAPDHLRDAFRDWVDVADDASVADPLRVVTGDGRECSLIWVCR